MRQTSFRIALLVALPLLAAAPASAVSEEEQIAIAKGWVVAHNSGDVAKMARFRARHFQRSTVTGWQATFEDTVDRLGRLEVYGVMILDDGTVMLGVSSDREGRMRLVFRFHDDAPDQIREIGLEDAGRGGDDALPPLQLPDGWDERRPVLDTYLRRLADQDRFSGTVMIVERGTRRFEGAYGLASREFGVPNNLDTRFDVGSFNKDYTRLAVLQLMLEGKLALSDTVGKHLPDYPNAEAREKVTVEQLLEHRSGLGDYFTEEWRETPMGRLREIDDYIPVWGPLPLEAEPGTRKRYSNYGYTVLGAIVEKVSGLGYPEYVVTKIFEPAGMHDSGFFETDEIVPNVAVGYTRFTPEGPGNRLYKNIYLEPAKGGPWGKSYSTVADLYRFFEAMFDGLFLPEEHNWLRAGWDSGGIGLAGGGPGLNAELLLEDGLMVLVMANLDPPVAGQIAKTLHAAAR